jgi:subtilase family serine protease
MMLTSYDDPAILAGLVLGGNMRSIRSFKSAFALAIGLLSAQTALGQNGKPVAVAQVQVPNVVQHSTRVGHADSNRLLHVSVSLPYADTNGLEAYVDSVSDPKNPNYRNFITPQEVGARFGLPITQVQSVASYLKGYGFKVNLIAKNRASILAEGSVAQAEAAFHTTINDYRAPISGQQSFFSFSTPLQLPPAIASKVLDVEGLESFTKPHFRALTPTQTRVLYNLAPMYNAGVQGQGRNVAISNFDGFRLTNVPLYYSHFGLPTPSGGVGSNVHVVTISGGAGSGTPGAEGDLDIQMVLGMAPLCNFTIYDGGASDLIGTLTREANDNLADVISESYGWSLPASTATAAHNQHLSMSAEGITYMAASGDSGTSLEPYSYPNYEPEVLMVGGTVATTDSSGNRTSEVGWSGSGGGWSTNTATFNVRPSWQTGNGVPTNIAQRMSPDVALHASSSTGAYQFYLNGSLTSGYVGTSFASPVFAGSLAVAEQQIIALGGLPPNSSGKQRFGRIQDLFYSQNGRSDIWLDITSGSNGRLPNGATSNATAGWDMVTGWGAINFNAFVASQSSTSPDFTISASPSSQTVTQGSGTSYTATVGALNGFSGNVGLSVSGLPSGAGATFNPSSISGSGSSTLSVTTASTTPTGTYTLTITGTSGSLVHSTTVTLVVNPVAAPNFTIGVSPASRSVKRGSAASYTVTVTGTNGFAGVVSLSLSGAPSGTTVTFSPSSVTGSGTSTLTITTQTNTSRRTYNMTIQGTSGSLSHTAAVSLTVTR